MLRGTAETAALIGVCLVTGWLATLTGHPTAGEFAVWPPTGLGLVAILVRGFRLLPAVWLSHFVLALLRLGSVGDGAALLGAIALAIGYTGQTAFAAHLVRRFVGYPTQLCRPREIGWFLLAAGPVSALVGAPLTAEIFCAGGARRWDEFRAMWLTTAAADITGGVVFSLVALAIVGRPRGTWRPRAATVATPLAVACLLVGLGVQEAHRADDKRAEQVMSNEATVLVTDLTDDFAQLVEGLRSLEGAGGEPRSQLRFLNRLFPGVQSVGVAARVPDSNRAAFEQARRASDPDYQLYEYGPTFALSSAKGRPVHTPVIHFEPRGGRIDEGFDLTSVFHQGPVFVRAMESGQPSLSTRAEMIDSRIGVFGLVLVVPHGGPSPCTFAFASLDMTGWLRGAQARSRTGLACQLLPRKDGAEATPPAGGRLIKWPLDLADGQYELQVTAGPELLARLRTPAARAVVVGGALVVLLLGSLLLLITGQTALVAEVVASRTAELSEEVGVRKIAEAALQATTDQLAAAQRLANLGYWEYDPVTGEEYHSPQLLDLLGLPIGTSKLDSQLMAAHVYPEDTVEFAAAVATAQAQADPVSVEVRVLSASGDLRWIAMTLSGAAGRVCGAVLEITTQKRARFALEDAEARQRLTLAAGGMGTLRWDVGTTLLSWDARLQHLLGLQPATRDEGLAAFLAVVHTDDRDKVRRVFTQVEETAAPLDRSDCECEFRVVRPDGETRWVHCRGRVIHDAEDGPAQLCGLVYDVTDRRRAEDVLRASEARLAEAHRIARLGGWEWQLSTHLVWLAPETYQLLGRPPQDDPVLFETVAGWMHPDDRDRVRTEAVDAVQAGETTPEFEARFVCPDGEVRWFRSFATLVCDENGPAWLRGVSQDITDQKRDEERRRAFEDNLQQTQRLESLGILAGGIAHDFNNLLTGILGNASLAREVVPSDAELHEFLRPIEKSAEHAAQLCQQMLAYAGKGAAVRGPLDVNDLIRESADLVKLAASRKAELRIELGVDLPPVVGDAGQIRQVLLNLVQNASEALGSHGGSVTVRTRSGRGRPTTLTDMTWSGDPPSGEYVCLEVSDTGCGMSATTRARIFEPFFTTKFTGRGLGLSAVHGIVKHHGGAMSVASREGQGTTFAIYLPSGLELPRPEMLSDAGGPQLLSDTPLPLKRVALIADDEPPVRTLVVVALRALGFAVVEAEDGRAAREALVANPDRFTLAVLDLVMPGLDGRELLAELRVLRPDLPVVLVSGYSEHDLADLLDDPHVCYLPKPFRPNDLTSCVRQALQPRAVQASGR